MVGGGAGAAVAARAAVQVLGTTYYLVSFLDEYSRTIVHWELLSSMDGRSEGHFRQRDRSNVPCIVQ